MNLVFGLGNSIAFITLAVLCYAKGVRLNVRPSNVEGSCV